MAFQSPLDLRDWKARDILLDLKTIPTMVDYSPNLLPVRDQGKTNECVAYACCTLKENQELRDIGLEQYFSPSFIYGHRSTPIGMHIRDAMDILKNIGCKLEMTTQSSEMFKISSYMKIETLEDCKKTLASGEVCVILTNWYNHQLDFYKGIQPPPNCHATCIVGYNDETRKLKVRNSWGDKWGHEGYFFIDYNDWSCVIDCYSAVDLKTIGYKIQKINVGPKCCSIC